jgi:hypothetical protein
MLRGAAIVTVVLAAAACGGDAVPALDGGLLRSGDLPAPTWQSSPAQGSSRATVCGEPLRSDRPAPEDTASIAWARDRNDGPIVGERIERYGSARKAHDVYATKAIVDGCTWTEDGAHWRAAYADDPDLGDASQVVLITSTDRSDSFNYEVAIRSGDSLVLLVVNLRHPDRRLVNAAVDAAWTRALESGAVDR